MRKAFGSERKMPRMLCGTLLNLKSLAYSQGLADGLAGKASNCEDLDVLSSWKGNVTAFTIQLVAKDKKTLASANVQFENVSILLNQSWESRTKKFAAQMVEKWATANEEVLLRYGEVQAKITSTRNAQKNAHEALYAEIQKLGGTPPSARSFMDGTTAIRATIILNTVLETILSYPALDAHGIPMGALSILICLVFGILLGLSCHQFGAACAEDHKLSQLSWLGVAVSIVVIVIGIRATAPPPIDPATEHMDSTLLAFLNVILLIVGLLLGERVNRYREYFKAVEQVEQIPVKLDELATKETLKEEELQHVNDKFDGIVVLQANEEIKELQSKRSHAEVLIAESTAKIEIINNLCTSWISEGLAELKTAYQKGYSQSPYL